MCSTKKEDNSDDEQDSNLITAPDGGWGWMIVLGSFLIHIITDGVTYSFGVFYDEFLNYFKEGKAATAWILSILVGVTLCSGPISSVLVNRWGCRVVTILGAILSCICMIASMFAQNVVTLYFTIGIGTGFGFGLIYLPAIVTVTTYFDKKRSLATGIAVCGSGFGTFIFAPIMTRLLSEYGWRGSLLIIAGIALNCIVCGILFRPLPTQTSQKVQKLTNKATSDSVLIDSWSEKSNTILQSSKSKYDPTMDTNTDKITVSEKWSAYKANRPTDISTIEYNETTRMALSHPVLAQSDNYYNRSSKRNVNYFSQDLSQHRPLDNPDVFYQGSLMNIPSYRSRATLRSDGLSIHRHCAKYKISTESKDAVICCGLITCSKSTATTLKEMLDVSLLKNSVFILFSLSNLLTSIGFNVPYVYIVPQAKNLGFSVQEASMLLSIIGIANTVGRIILGYVSDKTWINRLYVYNASLMICGIATVFSVYCPTFITLSIYACVFGFTIGAYVGLTSVILVDLLGIEKLTNAFGLLLLFQGVASLVGPPIGGALYDITMSYDPAFYLAGIAIALSGLILFLIPSIQRCQNISIYKRKYNSDVDSGTQNSDI